MLATPAVRRLCREMSIDLSVEPIRGTGRGGRVLKGDVLAYTATRSATGETAIKYEMGAAVEVDTRQRHQQAGIAAYGTQEARFSSVDGVGIGLGPPLEPVSRRANGGSLGSDRLEGRTTIKGAAVGNEDVGEGGEDNREKNPRRRASGVREKKDPVSVPIKGAHGMRMHILGGRGGRGVGFLQGGVSLLACMSVWCACEGPSHTHHTTGSGRSRRPSVSRPGNQA